MSNLGILTDIGHFIVDNFILIVLILGMFLLLFADRHTLKPYEKAVLFAICIVDLTAVGLSGMYVPDSYYHSLTTGTANLSMIVCLLYVIYLCQDDMKLLLETQEKKLQQQRDSLMMSQIQPHFLYNTLNVIYYLCNTDPQLAKSTIHKFSEYLKNNLDLSSQPDQLIPFKEELEHTMLYADIEMLRFDHIQVIYDIRDEAFMVPALCIQPMVENAIRHGVRDVEEGIIVVSSFEEDRNHVIVVKDNGIGYKQEKQLGTHRHIGISNVRERIEGMCRGTFSIEMEKGVGTTVIMTIPKGKSPWETLS